MITETDTERLFESVLPRIKDKNLRKKTVRAWVLACQRGGWKSVEELEKIPFTLLTDTRAVNFIEHTIAVTEGAYGLAKAQEQGVPSVAVPVRLRSAAGRRAAARRRQATGVRAGR